MAAKQILANLESLPASSDDYLWCDYIELLCMTSVDAKCSAGNLLELMEGGAETNPPINDDDDDDDDVIADDAALGNIDLDAVGEHDMQAQLRVDRESQIRDAREARAGLFFTSLAFRQELFGDAYPFSVDVATKELTLSQQLTDAQVLYLQLLLSSSLRYVPKKRRHELTEPFEQLSAVVFACILPADWVVHRFGAKAANRYKGHLFERLKKLTKDLRGTVIDTLDDYKKRNSGDGGLDLVAWHSMGDLRVGIPIALAQCGCTAEDWPLKSLEASPSKLGAHIHVHHPWATYYFLPLDLARPKHKWQRFSSFSRAIMVDRKRLLYIARTNNAVAQCITARKKVTEAIELKRAA